MHISDCSSDVCSSDLCGLLANTRLRLPIVSCWGCAGETAPIRSRPTGKPALIVEYDRLAAPGGVPILRCAEIEDVGTDLAERIAVRRDRLSRRRVVPVHLQLKRPAAEHAAYEGGVRVAPQFLDEVGRSEEHTSELQSLMRISYAVFCLKKNT